MKAGDVTEIMGVKHLADVFRAVPGFYALPFNLLPPPPYPVRSPTAIIEALIKAV